MGKIFYFILFFPLFFYLPLYDCLSYLASTWLRSFERGDYTEPGRSSVSYEYRTAHWKQLSGAAAERCILGIGWATG